jgi:hypothetical protein
MRRFLPPQHGAWAMLAVPYVAGVLVAGWSWPAAPLAGALLAGYLLSYFVFQAVKSGRLRRYRTQIITYAVPAVALTAVVVAARPAALWYAPAFAALWGLNAWYARRRRERALLNDLASVVQSCLIVFVVAAIAGTDPVTVAGAFAACLAYFTGTALFVKTMIRERHHRAYRWRSVGYHAAVLPLAAWLAPALGALFAWLLVRAWWLPTRALAPKHVGMVEIANSLLLLAAIAFTWT